MKVLTAIDDLRAYLRVPGADDLSGPVADVAPLLRRQRGFGWARFVDATGRDRTEEGTFPGSFRDPGRYWRLAPPGTFELVFFESGDFALLELIRTRDELDSDFEISEGVVIPVGEYEFSRARLEFGTSETRPFSLETALEGGDFFDGEGERYAVGLRWQPGPAFVTVAGYERNDVSLAGGSFDTQLASWRANLSFSPELSWNNFVQWDTESDTLGLQSRLRWIPAPHQEVFLVFNETVEADSSATHAIFQELSFKIAYAIRF